MNNIQKAFKTKARMGLRMAAGGVVPNSFSQEPGDDGPAQAPSVGNNMDFTNKMKLQLADLQRENATPGGLGSSRVVNGVAMDGSADAAAAYEKTLQPQAQTSATPGTSPVSSPLATAKAFSRLSMIDQRNLTNPGNQPYGIDGQPVKQGRTFVTPGSAAEASMRDGQISALGNLRAGLRMADGGVVPKETPEQVMARMNAKFGLGGTPATTPAPAPAPAPKPAPAPAPSQPTATQGGLLGKTTDAIRNRAEELRKAANYADGGIIPVSIGKGLMQAVVQPIAEDWRQGNQAIKAVRDKYPTADALAGIHPYVAAAQTANDVMAGDVGGDTAMNVAQAVPMVKGLSGMAKALTKQGGPMIGGKRYVVDMPNTVRKNAVITAGQTLGQPANAYEKGGIVHGPGTRTSDSVPVHLSRGEAVLPGKTVDALGGPDAVEQMIESTNGRPPVRAGLRAGGNYADGTEGRYPYDGKPVPTAQQMYPGFSDLWQAVRAKDMPEGGYFANGEKPGPETPAPEWVRKMSPAYARAAQESPEAAQAVLVAGGSPSVQSVKPTQVTADVTAKQSAPVPVAAAPVQPANPAADIQSRSVDAEALRGFAQRSMNLPQTGTVVDRGNAGLRSIRDNAGVMNTLNEANSQQGTGITYSKVKGADGKDQVLISGGPATKDQYLGADGKPTNDWTKTAQYQQAIAQNAQDKARLKELQWDNAVSSAGSPSAGYRAEGLRTAQMVLAKQAADQQGAVTPMQQAQLGLQAAQLKATIDNRNIDNLRAAQQFKAGEDRSNRTEEREQFKDAATGADGKLNGESLALLNRAAAAYNDDPNLNAPQNSQAKITQAKTIQHTNDIGQHWFTPEKAQDGYTVPDWTMRQTNGLGDALRGYFTGNVYEDPITGQVISEREVSRMPPDVQEGFFRQMEMKKKARETAARRTAPTK